MEITEPTTEKVELFRNVISEKYPTLENVWGAVGGIKLNLQQSRNFYVLNQFNNGWTQNHYVNCLFTFALNGKIALCVLNAPGTFHYSTMVDYGLYEILEKSLTNRLQGSR